MTLPLTPEMCAAMYDYLCTTPPYDRWNLPASDERDEIRFVVTKESQRFGYYLNRVIGMSAKAVGHTRTLAETMSHEMIHFQEDRVGILWKSKAAHSPFFRKQALVVCKFHGFDPKAFY